MKAAEGSLWVCVTANTCGFTDIHTSSSAYTLQVGRGNTSLCEIHLKEKPCSCSCCFGIHESCDKLLSPPPPQDKACLDAERSIVRQPDILAYFWPVSCRKLMAAGQNHVLHPQGRARAACLCHTELPESVNKKCIS